MKIVFIIFLATLYFILDRSTQDEKEKDPQFWYK